VIVLAGNLSRDLLPGLPPRAGGGPFHGARALARLGAPALVLARCAEADRDSLFGPLEALGVPARYVPGEATATYAFSYEGDRREMRIDSLGDPWRPEDVPELPAEVSWVLVAPLARSDFPAETLAALANGRRLALDGQGLVREAQTGPLHLDGHYDPELLRHVWTLKLSDDEAAVIGDPAGLPMPEVIVTHGSRGATLYFDGHVAEIHTTPVDADPTGAGDMFGSAYVAARAAGREPVEAAREAAELVSTILGGL
jgi:prepilin-type processing-associated H-X9-DG protein